MTEIVKLRMPKALRLAAEAVWPSTDWPYWHRYSNAHSDKFASMDRCRLPQACLTLLDHMALCFAGHLDESFIDSDLHAAGMHMLPAGGFVGRHHDAEAHPIRPWLRTHSIVCFINGRWEDSWGGALEIETLDGNEVITPEPGLAVMFKTPGTWHQVHETAADAAPRKTLCLFGWVTAEGTGSPLLAKNSVFQNTVA